MTPADRQLFFQSGEHHVASVFNVIRQHVKPNFEPRTALDFGCGVGRVLMPLAERAAHVVGVDVAPSMLREAKSNCEAKGVDNVEFVQAGHARDMLPLQGRFDFVHSVSRLAAHSRSSAARRYSRASWRISKTTAFAAIHVLCWQKPRWSMLRVFRDNLPFAGRMWDALRRRSSRMEMNSYDLNGLLRIIRETKARRFHADLVEDQATLGVVLYVRKPPSRQHA